jgi:hypothetical protein
LPYPLKYEDFAAQWAPNGDPKPEQERQVNDRAQGDKNGNLKQGTHGGGLEKRTGNRNN